MARTKTPKGENAVLQANETAASAASLPRIKMGEVGFSSVKTRSGKIYEEANTAFRYPQFLKVVAEMESSPPVAIGLNALNTLMNRAEITVVPIQNETPDDRLKREFLLSTLHDMKDSWQSTMQHISTVKSYGHQVSEIVFRRRLNSKGSKYNDGLVGLAGLKHRPQNSIAKWNFSEDGRELISISQSIANLENSYRFQSLTDESGHIVIPREKFLLFRCDAVSDNPEGTSILKPCYLAYKQLSLLTDNMMTGVSKSVLGVPFAQLPPSYMSPTASASDKAVYTAVQTILNNLANGTASSVIFPKMVDNETKQDLFSLQILDQKAVKVFDVESIIKMLQGNILSVLSCDSIAMGAEKGGSLSLQDGGTNLLALSVAYRLSEIANTLNQELVPALWKANGWDLSRMPKFAFSDVSSVSLDEFGKYFQRIASVGGIEYTRDALNKVRQVGGFAAMPDDQEVNTEILSTSITGKESGASQGMEVGTTGNGTAKSPSKEDTSVSNIENKG